MKSKSGKPPAPKDAPYVTIGHVMQQLASAFATPFEGSATAASQEAAAAEAKKRWDRN